MDQAMLDKLAKMQEQCRDINKVLDKYAKKHGIDNKTVFAALVGALAYGIGNAAQDDIALQDQALMQVLTGIQINLAENGWRPFPDGFDVPDELIVRDENELS